MEENKQIQTVDSTTEVIDTTGASKKLAAMMVFVKENLKKGTDYMSIAGGKPTLLKSGAEKMNILMGFSAHYEKVKEVMNPKDSFYYVEVKCILKHIKSNIVVAECLASCNNQEKARKMVDFADSLNTVLKIAEKRAYVGATLNANALSQFYTQDLEDEVVSGGSSAKEVVVNQCTKCKTIVSQKVVDYCKSKNFDGVYCMGCQGTK